MITIIDMDEHRAKVRPKSTAEVFKGHRYVLQFNPGAVPAERWSFTVKYVRQYTYEGFASTEGGARTAARAQISRLTGREAKSV